MDRNVAFPLYDQIKPNFLGRDDALNSRLGRRPHTTIPRIAQVDHRNGFRPHQARQPSARHIQQSRYVHGNPGQRAVVLLQLGGELDMPQLVVVSHEDLFMSGV